MNKRLKSTDEAKYHVNEPGTFSKALIQGIIKFGLKVVLNVKSEISEEIDNLEGPTILIGNHLSAIDPFVMGVFVSKKWVHYITSLTYFENPVLKKILVWLGAIPKRQGISDIRTTKIVLNVLKNGRQIGLFPEGARTIDGRTLYFNNSAAKLVKQTGSNVVISYLKGASISLPRWYKGCSGGYRRGRIDHKAYVLLTKDAIADMTVEQIDEKIRDAIQYDEYDMQRVEKIVFKSKTMADGMHSILHKCPKCLKDFSTASKKNMLYCTNCGNTAIIDEYGLINKKSEQDIVYPDMPCWRRWQNDILCEEIEDPMFNMEFPGLLRIKDSYGEILRKYAPCIFKMDPDKIAFVFQDEKIILHMSNITDVVCDYSLRFEINLENNAYQFNPDDGQTVIKISDAIKCIKGILV